MLRGRIPLEKAAVMFGGSGLFGAATSDGTSAIRQSYNSEFELAALED
jgi:hypothetical protein